MNAAALPCPVLAALPWRARGGAQRGGVQRGGAPALVGWRRRARGPARVEKRTSVRSSPRPGIVAAVTAVAAARPDLEAERLQCERATQGDRAALGQLLRRYGPALYRSVLLPRLGSDAAAQDALAETYARVVERFSQFQWQSCGIYPWLRVIALRIALDMLRARRREALFEPEDLQREIDAAETDLTARGEVELCEKRDLADARARVEDALGRLNPRYAEAIRLRVLEERPRDEVAVALGVSVATFDVVLHRAMTALKKALAAGVAAPRAEPKERSR
ncbi:sigma-70 family RNA polymerase sigma factor [Sorangium sp. So ce291]|uniref:RNA polymerase sigma factor n=1 Tax=Sorangium sp. So ce291 TaxID=3133294 RepID=UPI003F6400C3